MTILDTRAVSAGQQYTVNNIPAAQNLYLSIINDSPFELKYWFDNNQSDARVLPPGAIVDNEEPGMAAPSLRQSNGWSGTITVAVSQPLGGTVANNPPAQQVTIEGFSQPRRINRSALARNIGGNVGVATSTIILGTGQVSGVTTADRSSVPNVYPTLIPATKAQTGQTDIALAPLDASGLLLISAALVVQATQTLIQTPLNLVTISQIGGGNTAGALGVAGVVASSGPVAVGDTAVHNIISFTPSVAGFYRANIHILLANVVSGNACTASVSYQDARGTNRTSNFAVVSGSTNVIAAGTTSMGNSAWAGEPLTFYAQPGANIVIAYRDPTSTPVDIVNAVLERLA